MDVGVGDLDALSRWIRFWTTGAILIISMVAWFGGLGDKSVDAPTMRLRNESKKAFRGLAVPVYAVNPVPKKEEPPEEDKKEDFDEPEKDVDSKKMEKKGSAKFEKQASAQFEDVESKKIGKKGSVKFEKQASVQFEEVESRKIEKKGSVKLEKQASAQFEDAEGEKLDDEGEDLPLKQMRQRAKNIAERVKQGGAAAVDVANRHAKAFREWYYHGGKTPWEGLELDKTSLKNKRPLLVFVNSRSGGGQGIKLLEELETHLHRIQVVDLAKEKSPMPALRWWAATGQTYRVLVVGGDGTVGWVLTCLEELKPDMVPPVAILPVGTGNDLARVLGWGGGFGGGSVVPELQKVHDAHPAYLDRWQVVLKDVPDAKRPKELQELPLRRKVMMCNYLGVGIDAAVALDFHLMRERSPHLFVSRLVNKVWYAKAGTLSPYRSLCENLSDHIVVECDGQVLEVPSDIQGIVVLNIPSFGGGCDLWNAIEDSDSEEEDDEEGDDGDDDASRVTSFKTVVEGLRGRMGTELERSLSQARPSMQDRRLEVVGVHGSLQLGAAQVGLYSAKRLKQASHVKIWNKVAMPVQVDGEPEMFAKNGEIEISFGGQALMLAHSNSSSHAVAAEVIEWGIAKGHIAPDKRNELMRQIAKSASKMRASASGQAMSG